jgi:hypothetical protein
MDKATEHILANQHEIMRALIFILEGISGVEIAEEREDLVGRLQERQRRTREFHVFGNNKEK